MGGFGELVSGFKRLKCWVLRVKGADCSSALGFEAWNRSSQALYPKPLGFSVSGLKGFFIPTPAGLGRLHAQVVFLGVDGVLGFGVSDCREAGCSQAL